MKQFTTTGEWVEACAEGFRVGLTKDAVEDLGTVTFVELPAVGKTLVAEQVAGTLEAVKAATDLYSPLSGRVTAINSQLSGDPGLVNRDPEHLGWLYCLDLSDPGELNRLRDREQGTSDGTDS